MAQYDPTIFQMNQFNTTLCECTLDGTSCMQGFFCPWCTTAQNYNMLLLNQPSMDTGMCIATACIDIYCGTACLAHGVASVMTRNRARARFGITPDEDCSECIKGFFCSECSACQVYRELSVRGLWPGGICVSTPFVKAGLVLPPMQTMDPYQSMQVQAQPLQAYPVQAYPAQSYPPPQQGGYDGQQPGYGGQPQPGYGGQPQPGYGGQPQPGYGGQPQPGYGGQPGFAPQHQAGYPPQAGYGQAPPPQAGYGHPAPQQQPDVYGGYQQQQQQPGGYSGLPPPVGYGGNQKY